MSEQVNEIQSTFSPLMRNFGLLSPKEDNNVAYIKMTWTPFDKELGKINRDIPVDMDLMILGLTFQNKLVDNRYAIYSLNPNSLQMEGVYHSGEDESDERLYSGCEEAYINFSKTVNVERYVVIALSHAIEVAGTGQSFRTPLNKVRGLKIEVEMSGEPDTKPMFATELENLSLINGKYAVVYGSFERMLDENNQRNKWKFQPLLDVDIPSDLAPILKAYGAVGVEA